MENNNNSLKESIKPEIKYLNECLAKDEKKLLDVEEVLKDKKIFNTEREKAQREKDILIENIESYKAKIGKLSIEYGDDIEELDENKTDEESVTPETAVETPIQNEKPKKKGHIIRNITIYVLAIAAIIGTTTALQKCSCSNTTSIVEEDNEFKDEVKKMNTAIINFINQMNTLGIDLDVKDVIYTYLHLNARGISNDLLFELGSNLTEAEISRGFEKVMVKVQEAYMVSTKKEFIPNIASLIEDPASKAELAKLDNLIVAYLGSTKDTRKQAASDINTYVKNYFGSNGYYKNIEPSVNTTILRTLHGIKVDGINSDYKIIISKSIVAPTSRKDCEKGIYDKTIYSEEYKTSKEIMEEKLARISILNLKGNMDKIVSYITSKINRLIVRINGIPTIQQVRDNLSDVHYKQTTSKTTTVASTPSMPKTASNEVTSGKIGSTVLGTSGDTRTTFTPNSGVSVNSNGTATYTDEKGTHEVTNITSDPKGTGEVSYPSGVTSSEVTSNPKYSSETTSYAENVKVDAEGNIWIYINGEWYLVTPTTYGSENSDPAKVKTKN